MNGAKWTSGEQVLDVREMIERNSSYYQQWKSSSIHQAHSLEPKHPLQIGNELASQRRRQGSHNRGDSLDLAVKQMEEKKRKLDVLIQ